MKFVPNYKFPKIFRCFQQNSHCQTSESSITLKIFQNMSNRYKLKVTKTQPTPVYTFWKFSKSLSGRVLLPPSPTEVEIGLIGLRKILVSREEPYGTKNSFKYFIGYNGNDIIRPLSIKLLQMTDYVKKFEDNPVMSFKISNKQLLKKCNQIWKRIVKLLKTEFDSEPVYGNNDKYIKMKNICW